MAVKPSVKGKKSSSKSSRSGLSTTTTARKSKSSASTSNKISRRPPTKQQKTKPGIHNPTSTSSSKRKKQRIYSDAELNLPPLNTITPASAATAPRGSGKKKNKVYVDDRESMMTIMALVNAEKEGEIESKMIKLRRMEEIREARRLEVQKREEERKGKLEVVKNGIKGKRKRPGDGRDRGSEDTTFGEKDHKQGGKKKRVSFA